MILVDSSVWIDYFRGVPCAETRHLDILLGNEPSLIGDLIVTEVLRGFETDAGFDKANSLLDAFDAVPLAGKAICEQAARNFQVFASQRRIRPQDDRHHHRDVLHRKRIRLAAQRP